MTTTVVWAGGVGPCDRAAARDRLRTPNTKAAEMPGLRDGSRPICRTLPNRKVH
jgi:hypothetical protein